MSTASLRRPSHLSLLENVLHRISCIFKYGSKWVIFSDFFFSYKRIDVFINCYLFHNDNWFFSRLEALSLYIPVLVFVNNFYLFEMTIQMRKSNNTFRYFTFSNVKLFIAYFYVLATVFVYVFLIWKPEIYFISSILLIFNETIPFFLVDVR